MSNKSKIYERAYNALIERFQSQPDVLARIQRGEIAVSPVVYYVRRAVDTATTKLLQDYTQSRVAGLTNFEKGKFPYKMTAAFSHIGVAYGYSATNVAANTIKYSNYLFNPTTTNEQTVNTRNYQVENDYVDTDIVNSELSVTLGDIKVYDRTPMARFFKQARYQTDICARGGIMDINNAVELFDCVTCTDANEPGLEINWNSGATLANYHYLEISLHGVEVAVR